MPDLSMPMVQPFIKSNTLTPKAPSKGEVTPGEAHASFANELKQSIDGLNKAQLESNQMTKALARGEADDLHNVMITAQKASITMQTTIEVRNKVVEAYKEIMRMQV